ncbi:hypothetical protein LUZ60_010883 [Juncus effusus]|nr:hypothetical protein LUZ60_010883 [Juncus effusus]
MMEYYGSISSNGEQYTLLSHCIEEILSFIKPLESDRDRRLNTINELAISIQSNPNLQGVTVRPFGSFVSNLYSKWGDLDISINLNDESTTNTAKNKKNTVLKQIRNILQRRGIGRKIQFIPQARVPLLNYESNLYGISCDLSVENRQGYVKSKIVQLMTSLDERFTDMVLLIKEWAKAQNINDPKTGTLNSYSLCLLVIFHLQTCEPAILPPMKEIYDGNISDDVEDMEFKSEKQIEDACASNIQKIISNISTRKNQSSLSELLISFFDKYSEIEALASDYAICPFTGRWEKITNNPNWTQKKSHNLFIEDPFEQPDNSARSVCTNGLKTISDTFRLTCQTLSPPSRSLSDRNALLYLLSRPLVSSKLGAPKKLSHNNNGYINSNNKNHHFFQQGNDYYANNRTHQNNNNNYNNMQYGVNPAGMTSQNRTRNWQVRLNGHGVGEPSQLNNANIINMNRNHVSNNNRAGYSYSNKSYGRVDPNLNLSRGIVGIAPTIGLAERVSNGSHNNRPSSSNQSYGTVDPDYNYNYNYNGCINGIVPTVGYAELVSNGSQNGARFSGSGSSQARQTWKAKSSRNDHF